MTLILTSMLQKSEGFLKFIIALLVAWLLAAHDSAQYEIFGVAGTYLYWTCRIVIEAAFFVAVLLTLERYFKWMPEWATYVLAILVSLVPFTLSITALDLIIGLPELGFNGDTTVAPDEKGLAFGLEIFYLLDNHIFLSLLLLMPRLLLSVGDGEVAAGATEKNGNGTEPVVDSAAHTAKQDIPLTFFESLEPPLDGHICSMEAQEHYISLNTTAESRMVLHRFSDAVRQTPAALGMQVHRSYWVAHLAVKEVVVEGQSMKLRLTDDKLVPVSRTFRAAVESRYASIKALSE